MLSLVHTRHDEDILAFPEVPSIVAGYSAHIVDHIRGVTGDPYIGIIADIYCIGRSLFSPSGNLLSPVEPLAQPHDESPYFLLFALTGFFPPPHERVASLYHEISTSQG
jgi:hypothetical protein